MPNLIAAFRTGTPDRYRPPMTDMRVTPAPSSPTIQETRWHGPNRHGRQLAFLDTPGLSIPKPLARAVDAYLDLRAEQFVPPAQLVDLARLTPSLMSEARRNWTRAHRPRVAAALANIGRAVVDAAPVIYEQAAEHMRAAVEAADTDRYNTWSKVAYDVRMYLPGIEGHTPGNERRWSPMPAGVAEWVVGRPDLWHDAGRPVITARELNRHPEWEPGCYTAEEVIVNVNAAAARSAAADKADRRAVVR